MRSIKVLDLDYQEPINFFKKLKGLNGLVFLDSAGKDKKLNQFSYIAALPVLKIKKRQNEIFIDAKKSQDTFFQILDSLLII